MKLTKRQGGLLAIALAGLIVLTLIVAPGGSSLRRGSTYSRSPDGYGAWYAFMQARGTPVQRWQKPLADLLRSPAAAEQPAAKITLLQISNGTTERPFATRDGRHSTLNIDEDWLKRGNVMVYLGVKPPVSQAPFSSQLASPAGAVQIETSRRYTPLNQLQIRLRDDFGAVVWQEEIGDGRIIYAATPSLAANAYQATPGNFELLAKLVTEPGYPIWVNEYAHGYRDAATQQQEARGNLFSYLAQTPLLLVALQAIVLLSVLIWTQNQRFGAALSHQPPAVDNSEAYIQAMASVLRKAESSQFVVETIGKAEQLELQKSLGLGSDPIAPETLLAAWSQQTGQPAATLETALAPVRVRRRLSEPDLLRWMDALRQVWRSLPSRRPMP